LLLNIYSIEQAGCLNGKVGISLTLFELSRRFNDERLENHAFNLLQEALAHDVKSCDFATGHSGMAYTISYLIDNKFIDADYFELYGKQHNLILKTIKTLKYNASNDFSYIHYLFYIHSLDKYIDSQDFAKCNEKIVSLINRTLNNFEKNMDMKAAHRFHVYASTLLATNHVQNEKVVTKIHRIQKQLDRMDYICQFPLFPLQMYFAGRKEYLTSIRLCMNNLIPEAINFRLKTDLFINLYRLYHIDNSLDYRVMAEEMMKTFTYEDKQLFENELYENIIGGNPDSFGISKGMSRLFLLNLFNDKILHGENVELLNI
jgi:hypothetical protein